MPNLNNFMGWVPPTEEQTLTALSFMPIPVMGDISPPIKGTGKGKVRILSDCMKIVNGKHIGQVQKTDDCTSFASAHCCDYLTAFEICVRKEREKWMGLTSTEDLYGGSRILIGKGQLGNGGGSIGAWLAQYISKYGTLLRKKYDKDDLSNYDPSRADSWGRKGVPEYLVNLAKSHPVKLTTLVRTYEEARDCIYNGYPVNVCSNQGFSSVRDSDGFLRPQGSWAHSMACIGVDDSFKRPAILIQNSWPYSWVSGNTRHDMPPGSFWVDADVINRMLGQGDSYAYGDRLGWEVKKLNLDNWV